MSFQHREQRYVNQVIDANGRFSSLVEALCNTLVARLPT